MKNLIRQSAILMLLFVTSMFAFGQPYIIPDVNTADDYGSKVYIDPSDNTEPYEGTLSNPYNAWSQVSFSSNTAYLLKAGTTLDAISDITVSNIYVGKYGSGAKPIIGARLDITGDNVTIDSVDFFYERTAYAAMIGYSAEYLTLSNCQITGVADSEGLYPHRGVQGGGSYFTMYHCEVSYTENDGYYGGTLQNCVFVSNYFHHNSMSNYPVYTEGSGDGIQFESAYADNAYLANNFIDREISYWKFALIFNSSLAKTSNAVCEWNTFISPKVGNGGLAVRWLGGTDNTFTKNLINTNDGITGIASASNLHLNQDYPYGVRDNHEFGPGQICSGCTSSDNLDFASESAYESYLTTNGIDRYGSDLDTSDFWGEETVSLCVSNPITVSAIVTDDINSGGIGSIDLTVSGGNGTLYYSWSDNSVTEDVGDLAEGTYEVVISDDESCSTARTYTVYNVSTTNDNEADDYISIDTVYTSSDDDVNVGVNMLDNDKSTRWSCSEDSAVAVFPLDGVYQVSSVNIAFYKGDERNTYFSIFGSTDGDNWVELYSGSSSGTTLDFESFDVGDFVCSYIAIVGYGNNQTYSREWTSITEAYISGEDYNEYEVDGTYWINMNNGATQDVDGYVDLYEEVGEVVVDSVAGISIGISDIETYEVVDLYDQLSSTIVEDSVIMTAHRVVVAGHYIDYYLEGLDPDKKYGLGFVCQSTYDYYPTFVIEGDTLIFSEYNLDSIVEVEVTPESDGTIEFSFVRNSTAAYFSAMRLVEYGVVSDTTNDTGTSEPSETYKQVFIVDEDGNEVYPDGTDLYIKEE